MATQGLSNDERTATTAFSTAIDTLHDRVQWRNFFQTRSSGVQDRAFDDTRRLLPNLPLLYIRLHCDLAVSSLKVKFIHDGILSGLTY